MDFSPTGFWSYAHSDDENSGGHVLRLARQLSAEFRLLTGAELTLFVDREGLAWGDEWRKKIDTSIHGTTFFIPIITPTYFQREECRRELLLFHRKASASNLGELLLPIIFAPINFDENSEDEVLAIVSRLQGEPFADRRLDDENSSVYKRAINKLATRLKEVSDAIDERAEVTAPASSALAEATAHVESDGEPGFIDLIAEMLDHQLPAWVDSIGTLTSDLNVIAATLDTHGPQLIQANNSRTMGPRLIAVRNAAIALETPTTNFLEDAKLYRSITAEIGKGIKASADMALMSGDQEEIQQGIEAAQSIVKVQETLDDAMSKAEPLLDTMRDMVKLSRDMRPPTKRIAEALKIISDSRTLYGEWIDTLDRLRSALL
jgi:hypothetical protein